MSWSQPERTDWQSVLSRPAEICSDGLSWPSQKTAKIGRFYCIRSYAGPLRQALAGTYLDGTASVSR